MKKILCRFLAMSICFMFVFQGMVYAADVPEETTEQPQTEETTDTEIKEDIPESSIEESTETETEDETEVIAQKPKIRKKAKRQRVKKLLYAQNLTELQPILLKPFIKIQVAASI